MAAGAPTISASNYHPFQRLCLCRTRFGDLLAVNGLNRGFRWDGITATVEDLGIDAPSDGPTIASESGGAGTFDEAYLCAYRYIDDTLPDPVLSSISDTTSHTPAADDYKFSWSDLSASSQARAHRVRLYRSVASGTNVLYLVVELGHNGTVATITDNGSSKCRVTTSETHNLAVGAVVTIAGCDIGGYNTSHEVTAVNAANKTFDTDIGYSSDGTGGTWQLTGYEDDDASDASIVDNDYILILEEDGTVSARRFTAPPDWAAYVTMHQDVYWYAGLVNYDEGTVATDGTTTITFTSATLTAQMAGRYIRIDGENQPFLISSVNVGAGTAVLAVAPSNTDNGLSYVIYPDPSHRRKLRYTPADEPESSPDTYTVTIQENIGDDDEIVGMKPWGSHQYVFMHRSKYIVTFVRQPRIDAHPQFVDDRGAFNHWCVTDFEDGIYAMDENGPYRFGSNVRSVALAVSEPIGQAIHDLWRDATIDFSKTKYFFVEADHANARINFHVCFTGDTGNYPQRMLSFNVRRNTWDPMQYVHPLGAACSTTISGRRHVLVGGESEEVFYLDKGDVVDVVATAITGTATAGGNNTLTDSGASFADTEIGAPVGLTGGTGKGQIRKVSARTSTQLTVSENWTTNPSTDTTYAVGAIEWTWKSQRMKLLDIEMENPRQIRIHYDPTTNANTLDARVYENHESSPRTHAVGIKLEDGVTIDADNTPQDIVFDLKLARSALGNASGFLQHRFDAQLAGEEQTDRFIQVELRGFQVNESIVLNELTIYGVG